MGKKETIDVLIEGGKASPAPPLGSSLGPLKVNVGQIVADINAKTADFKGMKVPVKVIVDIETKEYEINVGTPPTSQLIKSELGLKTGSGRPNLEKCGIIAVEQVIKLAKMKDSAFFTKNLKNSMKIVLGSCRAIGLLVEGKLVQDFMVDLDAGMYDDIIEAGKTEVDAEKLSKYKAENQEMQNALVKSKKAAKEAEAAKEGKKK